MEPNRFMVSPAVPHPPRAGDRACHSPKGQSGSLHTAEGVPGSPFMEVEHTKPLWKTTAVKLLVELEARQ